MSKNMKRFFSIMCVLLIACTFVFAAQDAEAGDDTSGVSAAILNVVAICTGVVPGAVVAAKFIFDLVKAYISKEQDPELLKKTVVRLLITVGIMILYATIISYIFGENAGDGVNFVSGLTGAEVSSEYLLTF